MSDVQQDHLEIDASPRRGRPPGSTGPKNSLWSLHADLSELFGMTADMVHDRHRQLVRCGHLPANTGRGPGSGPPANLEMVSTLIAAMIITDNASGFENLPGEFDHLVQKVKKAIKNSSKLVYVRTGTPFIKTTIKISSSFSRTVRELLEAT